MKLQNRIFKMDNLDAVSFFNGLVFFSPVALLVRTETGISVNDFFVLQALLSICIFVGEIPTGRLSDKLGHRNTLILSQLMLLFARVLLLAAFINKSMVLFVIEVFVEGMAACFSSGTQSAYIYSVEPKDTFVSKTAHVANCGTAGFVISTITYVFIYKFYGIPGLLVATILADLAAVIASFGLRREVNTDKRQNCVMAGKCRTFKSVCNIKTVWIIVFLASINIAYVLINFFFVEKLMEIDISEVYMTPVILGYSIIQLSSEFILNKVKTIEKNIVFVCSFFLAGLMLCFLGLLSDRIVIVAIMLVLPLVIDISTYLLDEVQNKVVDEQGNDKRRAEIISIFNMGVNLVEIVFLFGSAYVANLGTMVCFIVIGITMILLGNLSIVFKPFIK